VSYLLAFLAIAALVLLHEFGHFVAAKAVGMRVEKFSLFFGPMIVKRTIGDTVYGIGVIPLGGYVKISGMSPEQEFVDAPEPREAEDEPSEPNDEVDEAPVRPAVPAAKTSDPRAYVNMAVWKRVVVILAGPAMNLIVAFVILTALFSHYGTTADGPRQVSAVMAHSAAATALRPGDYLLSVNGARTDAGIKAAVDKSHCTGKPVNNCVASPAVTVLVRRHGKLMHFSLSPQYDTSLHRPLIGFNYDYSRIVPLGLTSAAHYGIKAMWTETSATVHALSHIFQAKERKQFHSIVGAYTIAQEAVSASPGEAFSVVAAISLALGLINLLPFLPLDGGHIFWALAEKVTRRKISLATIERASIVGIGLVLILVAIGVSNDVHGLLNGGIKLR
jgi:regulator of sigma E protease